MQWKINNSLKDIYDFEALLLEEIEKRGYDENSRFALRLSLDEALVNAYKHGNKEDPAKKILVEAEIADDGIEVVVEDDGEGFDQSILLDPRKGDRLRRKSGRGVFLIRQFMSTTRYNEKGNRLTFTYLKRNDFGLDSHGLAHWKYESATVLELDPDRVGRNPEVILESVRQMLESGVTRIILDLKFIEKIDSAVLGHLVGATREAEGRRAVLVLARPQPDVERVIRATSLDAVLKVYAQIRQGLDEIES
jgi:serine/threonine-protein kinase RsbW